MIMVVRSDACSVGGEPARAQPSGPFERWLALALAVHLLAVLFAWALFASSEMRALAEGMRKMQRDLFGTRLDIGVEQPAPIVPPPQPPPPEEPAVAMPPPPPPPVMKPRAPEPPPEPPPEPLNVRAQRAVSAAADAVAEAAKVLTRDDDAPGAVAIASGEGDALLSGMVAGDGKGTTSTFNPRAALNGKPGGGGGGPRPQPEPGPDRSRSAGVIAALTDECQFPAQAGIAGIDHAVVVMVVRVRPDGTAAGASVISDPGYGFGEAARQCAFRTQFIPARDRSGKAISGETRPFNFRFTRN
jgi:periplasmic protein TonB